MTSGVNICSRWSFNGCFPQPTGRNNSLLRIYVGELKEKLQLWTYLLINCIEHETLGGNLLFPAPVQKPLFRRCKEEFVDFHGNIWFNNVGGKFNETTSNGVYGRRDSHHTHTYLKATLTLMFHN